LEHRKKQKAAQPQQDAGENFAPGSKGRPKNKSPNRQGQRMSLAKHRNSQGNRDQPRCPGSAFFSRLNPSDVKMIAADPNQKEIEPLGKKRVHGKSRAEPHQNHTDT
jgi:hypothetical protein